MNAFESGSHTVIEIYRIEEEGITIAAVVHGRRVLDLE
jgi:hypothetical protein